MYNSKLIDVFQSLSPDEKRKLRKYFQLHFVNKNDTVYQLFLFLDSRKNISPLTVKKERLHQYLYPDTPYNDQHIRHLMWLCVDKIEEFLIVHSFLTQKKTASIQLLSVYAEKGLHKYALETKEKLQSMNEVSSIRDSNFYRQQLDTEQQMYQIATENTRYTSLNIQQILNHLSDYTMAETLRWACIALSHQRISGVQYQMPLMSAYLSAIEKGHFQENTAVQLYFLIYKVSVNEEDETFEQLYAYLLKSEKHFSETENRDVFLLVINYCIRQMNVGKQLYARYAFDLYMHALQHRYLLENDKLVRFTFKNIAFIAIRQLKDFKVAAAFIDEYGHFLAEDYREETVLFCTATMYFEQKNYQKAMPILQRVDLSDVLWNMNARNMLLKMYFEEAEYDLFNTFLDSYYRYLKRQKEIGYHKPRYLSMIAAFKKLYRSIGATKAEKLKFRRAIEEDTQLPEKEWILMNLH